MKEYSNSEVMDMLEKNPSLEFKCKSDDIEYTAYAVRGIVIKSQKQSSLYMNMDGPCSSYGFKLGDKWTLVEKPVSFMEAVKSGKNVRVVHRGIGLYKRYSDIYYDISHLLNDLSYEYTDKELARIIIEGEWYVEGGLINE